jgi:hypothetical protein
MKRIPNLGQSKQDEGPAVESDISQSADYRRRILHYTLMPDHLHLVIGLVLRHNGYSSHPEPLSYSFNVPRQVASQLDNPAMDRLLELVESSLGLAGGEHVTVAVESDDEGGTIFHAVSNHPDGSTGRATLTLNIDGWFVLESSPAPARLTETAAPEQAAPPVEVEEELLEAETEIEAEADIEEIPEHTSLPQTSLPDEDVSELPSVEPTEAERDIHDIEDAHDAPTMISMPTVSLEVGIAPPEVPPTIEEPEPVEEAEPPPVEVDPLEETAAHPAALEEDTRPIASDRAAVIGEASSPAYNRQFAASLSEEFVESLPEAEQSFVRRARTPAAAPPRRRAGRGNWFLVGMTAVTALAMIAGALLIWQPPFLASQPVFSTTPFEQQAAETSEPTAVSLVVQPSATPIPPTETPIAVSFTPAPTVEPVRGLFNYIVNENDTIVDLADRWGLDPTSILLCNPETLPNALALRVGLELRIPPEDGACINADGERTVADIAYEYGVSPEVIIDSPHNGLSGLTPEYTPVVDALIFIPGGTKTFQERNWSSEVTINPDTDVSVVDYAPDHPGSCGEIELQPEAVGTEDWVSPLYFYQRFTQGYHPWHLGLDIAGKPGTPVFASDKGTIVFSGWNNWGYGNLVVIDHGNGWSTFYGHLQEIYYDCGEIVRQGDVIGELGSTGNSTGPHLHFEIHKDGRSLDPQIQIDF